MNAEHLSQAWRTTLAFAALLVVAHPATAATIEDWSSGTDAAWTRVDLLELYGLGGTSYTISGGQYHMTSNYPLPPVPYLLGSASVFSESLLDPDAYASGYLTTRFTIHNANSCVFVPMRADVSQMDFISFFAENASNSIGMTVFDNFEYVNGASASFTIEEEVEYYLTAGAVGTELSIKVWPVGSPEPASPQVTLIDATFTSGQIGLGAYNREGMGGTMAASFGEVSFIPEPAGLLTLLAALGLLAARRRK
ncbi:MAG: PEP-CTERM sorting domain-containing protein [Phycisphaerae bacterium]|nr:PEP-CTERM sorting domain-containing protein [Phycisphaerae bacterium]